MILRFQKKPTLRKTLQIKTNLLNSAIELKTFLALCCLDKRTAKVRDHESKSYNLQTFSNLQVYGPGFLKDVFESSVDLCVQTQS